MSTTRFGLPGQLTAAPSALVVEPALPQLLFVLSVLSSIGFDVTVAETFGDAKSSLVAKGPALLLTDVKLREYNGLHLVLRGKALRRDLPAIVTSQSADAVLQADAERLGATFVELPTTRDELIAAVYRTALRKASGSGALDPIRAPFERRRDERRKNAPANLFPTDRRTRDRRQDVAAALRTLARR
jgi:DNA-binding NtrC family response regulator